MTAREEILQMAEEGVITQEEAQRLLDALGESASGQTAGDTVQEKPPACPPEGVITGCGTRTENPGKKIRVEVEVGGLQLLPSADGRLYSEVKLHSMRDRLSNYNYGVEERGEETVVHMSRKLFRPWGRNEGATLVVYVPRDTAVADCKVNVGGCTAEGVCADQLKLRTETGGIQLTGVHAQEAFVGKGQRCGTAPFPQGECGRSVRPPPTGQWLSPELLHKCRQGEQPPSRLGYRSQSGRTKLGRG